MAHEEEYPTDCSNCFALESVYDIEYDDCHPDCVKTECSKCGYRSLDMYM